MPQAGLFASLAKGFFEWRITMGYGMLGATLGIFWLLIQFRKKHIF